MGIFREEVVRYRYIPTGDHTYTTERYKAQRVRSSYKTLAVLSAIGALGFGIFSNEGLGAWGHGDIFRSSKSMEEEAAVKYNIALKMASPAELFELRYLDHSQITVDRVKQQGSGIVGFMDGNYFPGRVYNIGDGCLNDTAYDINGGQLHFNVAYQGLLSSVNASATGNIPTAAAQAIYNPSDSILTIRSGNTHSNDLTFKLNETQLIPVGQTTEEVLGTYGCKSSVTYQSTTPPGGY